MQRLLLSLLALLVATGTDALAGDFQLTEIHPAWGVESLPTEVEIEGMNFTEGTEVALVGGGAYMVRSIATQADRDVAIRDGLAYAVGNGVQVFDVSDPWSPNLLSTLSDVSGDAIAVSGDYAYVSNDGTLSVVNVSNPLEPRLIGTAESCRGKLSDVDVSGSLAVIACGSKGGIVTLDVGDPADPRALGGLARVGGWDGANHEVVIRGHIAFVTDRFRGLAAVDISEPSDPVVLSMLEPRTSYGLDLDVAGGFAYVTGLLEGVQVVDISDPTDIALVGQAWPSRHAMGIGVSGGFAFVSDGAGQGVDVYDIRDPHNPLRSYTIRAQSHWSAARNIEVDSGFAYVPKLGASFLDIYDVRVPALPGIIEQLDVAGNVYDIRIDDDKAYVAAYFGGLQIFDISEPASPVLLGETRDVVATDVVVRGDLAYVARWFDRFHIIDISNSSFPRVVGSFEAPDHVYRLEVKEPFVYISPYELDELMVVDTTDIANPTSVVTLAMDDHINELVVTNDLLYVANSCEGLVIMDLSNPALPSRISTLATPGCVTGVAVSGDLAYVADGPGGFYTVDVSDPSSPTIIGTLQNGIAAYKMAVSGTTAFVSALVGGNRDFLGMLMIDVSEPTAPRLVGGSHHLSQKIAVSADLAHLASQCRELQFFQLPPVQEAIVQGPDKVSLRTQAGMNPGAYHVLGLNPDGQFDILRNAFSVLPDGDGDGVPTEEDCDDENADVYPGAADLPGNTVDENCDGTLACDPAAEWKNRGEFVSCVAQECALLREGGLVAGQECGELIRDARRPATGQD